MVLQVWTARISTKDPDRFDVSRKSGNQAFAPSWALLGPVIRRRQEGRLETEEEWRAYVAQYLQEMARSHRLQKAEWDALLVRERVVLTCYCTAPHRCHRRVLARILTQLGAEDCGELTGR